MVVAAAVGSVAAPASAKSADACKLLKASEISGQFGGTVGTPSPTKTVVSVSCEYPLTANGTRPAGKVIARIMTTGGKAAFLGLKNVPGYVPVAGLSNSLYSAATNSLDVLKGDNLVAVQGVFVTPPPISVLNTQTDLVPLIKLALKRA